VEVTHRIRRERIVADRQTENTRQHDLCVFCRARAGSLAQLTDHCVDPRDPGVPDSQRTDSRSEVTHPNVVIRGLRPDGTVGLIQLPEPDSGNGGDRRVGGDLVISG
jgi:hypothetical protein